MQVDCYLIVQGVKPRHGLDRENRRVTGNIRITKNRPNTKADEIAVRLKVDIPDALFVKPTLEARVSVPEGEGRGPKITTDVTDNITQVLRDQLGVNVHVSADDPTEVE